MEEVFELLDRDDFLEIVDDHNNTLLHNLLNQPNIQTDVVKQLLDRGLDINATNVFGYTPLHYAICNPECSVQLVQLLLDRGASIDLKDEYGNSTLHYLLRQSDLTLIKVMVDRGADVNVMNNEGDSPLSHAVSNARWATNFPDAEEDPSESAMAVKLDILKIILDHEPDIDLRNNTGDTPLHWAVNNCQNKRALIRLLLRRSADVNLVNHKGDSSLLRAMQRVEVDVEVVKMLLDCGADINVKNNCGDFPLCLSVKNPSCSVSTVKLLLDRGANVISCDKLGETSLQKAIESYEQDESAQGTVKLLIKYTLLKSLGFNINRLLKNSKHRRSLTEYATECSLEIFRMGMDCVGKNDYPDINDPVIFTLYEFMRGYRSISHSALQLYRGINTNFDEILRILHSKKFPLFNDVLSAKIKRKDMMQKLKEQLFFAFQKGADDYMIFLDYYSACEVAQYLSNEDLLNWILAFYGSFKHICVIPNFPSTKELLGKRMLEDAEGCVQRFKLVKR